MTKEVARSPRRPDKSGLLAVTANVGTGLQTCPKRTDLKVYPYDLVKKGYVTNVLDEYTALPHLDCFCIISPRFFKTGHSQKGGDAMRVLNRRT